MTRSSFTETWEWDEDEELDANGAPTGNVLLRVATIATPEGYVFAVPAETTSFERAMNVQSLWLHLGRPARDIP